MAEPVKNWFGANLAQLLADKLVAVHPAFPAKKFVAKVAKNCDPLEYKGRQALITQCLQEFLPPSYPDALAILLSILGPENPEETGMFKNYWWVGPIALFVETYGLDHYDLSINALAEITKRNTAEYAIRPYIVKYPNQLIEQLSQWAVSPNFHLRRLASEGCRPRLPWAKKLTLFIDDPSPVFAILEMLKTDPSDFVRRSVVNNLNDYLKDNPTPTWALLKTWSKKPHPHTQKILFHALRNERKAGNPKALELVN